MVASERSLPREARKAPIFVFISEGFSGRRRKSKKPPSCGTQELARSRASGNEQQKKPSHRLSENRYQGVASAANSLPEVSGAEQAKKAKLTGRVDDHKFRSTAITLWLQAGHTVPDVMRWVGHVDPKTILRYAEKVNLRRDETRKRITKTFDAFASMGD